MENLITSISNSFLQDELNAAKRYSRNPNSMQRYVRWKESEERSDKVLKNFKEGKLILKKNQYTIFALYIDTFCSFGKEEYFQRLQKIAGFDVQEYIKKSKMSFKERLFYKKGSSNKTLTAKQLVKNIRDYRRACDENDGFVIEVSRRKAEKDVFDFLINDLTISPENTEVFKNYILTILYPVAQGSNEEKALKKIEDENKKVVSTPTKTSFVSNVKSAFKSFAVSSQKMWANTVKKVSSIKISMPKFKAPKFKKPSFKMPSFNMPQWNLSENNKDALIRAGKVVGVVAVMIAGATFVARKCSGNKEEQTAQNQNKIEKTQQPQKDTIRQKTVDDRTFDLKTIHFTPVSTYSFSDFTPTTVKENVTQKSEPKKNISSEVKKQDTQKQEVKKTTAPKQNTTKSKTQQTKTTSGAQSKPNTVSQSNAAPQLNKRQAVVNHHEHILSKRLGQKGKEQLYGNIENQLEKGIFTLPDSLGKEEFAYALTMYRAYGVKSSLQNACTATKKLTKAENEQIVKDIVEAGDTGLGVQKKAEQIRLQKHLGPLSHKGSLYDRMSKKDKKQHVMNLQQWRKARQMAQSAK